MNDTDLWNKAAKAGYDYRTVHGCFPDKIGIHFRRLRQFGRDRIIFPEPPPIEVNCFTPENVPVEGITINQHVARFEAVIGKNIQWDEVYVPIPDDARNVMSGEEIAAQARELERERRAGVLLGLRMPSDWSDLSR